MSKKTKECIFDIVIVLILIIALVAGVIQVNNVAFVISLTALLLSGFNFYFNVYRPRYLLKPELHWEPNCQISPPTPDEKMMVQE